jgi:hypothetical protein
MFRFSIYIFGIYLFLISFYSAPLNAAGRLINILIISDYGDMGHIAANILMAKQLARLYPENTYNLIVPDASGATDAGSGNGILNIRQKVQILEPEVDFSFPNRRQFYDGVNFILYKKNDPLPLAYASICFSNSKHKVRPETFYLENNLELPRIIISSAGYSGKTIEETDNEIYKIKDSTVFLLGSGALNFGMYLNREKPDTDILKKLVPANSVTAFYYAHNKPFFELYVHLINSMIKINDELKSKKIILYTVNAANLDKESVKKLPGNVEIRSFGKLKFNEMHALIQSCNIIPPMLTGDVSASQALSAEILPIYEVRKWREEYASAFVSVLSSNRNVQEPVTDIFNSLLEKNIYLSKSISNNDINIKEVFPNSIVLAEKLAGYYSNKDLMAEIKKGIGELIETNSLSVMLNRIISNYDPDANNDQIKSDNQYLKLIKEASRGPDVFIPCAAQKNIFLQAISHQSAVVKF